VAVATLAAMADPVASPDCSVATPMQVKETGMRETDDYDFRHGVDCEVWTRLPGSQIEIYVLPEPHESAGHTYTYTVRYRWAK
jgi:hypothetical protein